MITICEVTIENSKHQLSGCACSNCGLILSGEQQGNKVMYIQVTNEGKGNLIWFCHKCRLYFQRINNRVKQRGGIADETILNEEWRKTK